MRGQPGEPGGPDTPGAGQRRRPGPGIWYGIASGVSFGMFFLFIRNGGQSGALAGGATRAGLFGIAVVLTSLYSGVTVLLARVVLGERMRGLQRAGLALAAVGILLVTV